MRIEEICRKVSISNATFYKWWQKYAGLGPSELKKLKQFDFPPLTIQVGNGFGFQGEVVGQKRNAFADLVLNHNSEQGRRIVLETFDLRNFSTKFQAIEELEQLEYFSVNIKKSSIALMLLRTR